jgi:hypothetical protein
MPIDETERLVGTKYFRDQVTFATGIIVPDASLKGSSLDPNNPASADALKTRVRYKYSQGNVAATTETRGLGIVHGATGKIKNFYVSNSNRATGDATVTVTLRKNGATVMAANVVLNNATPTSGATYATTEGLLNPALVNLVKGDVLDVVITAAIGTGVLPTEVMVEAIVDEDPV